MGGPGGNAKSQGTPKRSLRADAPVFQPAFLTQTAADTNSPHGSTNSKASGDRRKNRRRRNKKQHTSSNRQNGPKGQDEKKKVSPQNFNSKQKRPSRSRRRNGLQRHINPYEKDPNQDHRDDLSKVDDEVLKLDSFPNLSGDPAEFEAVVKADSVWSSGQAARKHLILEAADAQVPSKTTKPNYFESLGLEQLSRSKSTVPAKKPRSTDVSAWDGAVVNSTEDQQDILSSAFDDSKVVKTESQSQFHSRSSRRLNWNMTKLRDKWWDAVALQKARLQFLSELQSTIDVYYQPAEAFAKHDEDYLSSKANLLQEEDFEEEKPSIPSALEALMIDTERTEGNTFEYLLSNILQASDEEALSELLVSHNDLSNGELDEKASFDHILERFVPKMVHARDANLLGVALHYLNRQKNVGWERSTAMKSDRPVQFGFLIAAKLGDKDCLATFLSKWDQSTLLLSSRDEEGDNVLHYCCRGEGDMGVLELLFRHLSGKTKSKQQQMARVVLAKNKSSETALHIACAYGRVDFIEVFLDTCSIALLGKLLQVEDKRAQTPLLAAVAADKSDCVMALIMWRGNQSLLLHKASEAPTQKGTAGSNKSCPLVGAARCGNLDMIYLLLQFSDRTFGQYRVTEAVSALLASDALDDVKIPGSKVLIEHGGNPFSSTEMLQAKDDFKTAVSLACSDCSPEVLRNLVLVGKGVLRGRQQERRKDPILRQQPETFFSAIEARENLEVERCLSRALVQSLFNGYRYSKNTGYGGGNSKSLLQCVALYECGAQLKTTDLARLQDGIRRGLLVDESEDDGLKIRERCFATTYLWQGNPAVSASKLSELDRTTLAHKSSLLSQLEWFHAELSRSGSSSCAWLEDYAFTASASETDGPHADDVVTLATEDGFEFRAHESVLAQKSEKLASAFRFSRMTRTQREGGERKIPIQMSAANCSRMLQHMYHGSIVCGWSNDLLDHCNELLDLMFAAEEYLCASLVQECEMRLLSSRPKCCVCWSCSQAVRSQPGNEKIAECRYYVGGQSTLISGLSALNVLALCEYLEDGTRFAYTIKEVFQPKQILDCTASHRLWALDGKECTDHRPLKLIHIAAISKILTSFEDVVSSTSFRDSVEGGGLVTPDEIRLQKVLLLQMALEELAVVRENTISHKVFNVGRVG